MPRNGELEQIRIHIARLLVVIANLPLLRDSGERRGVAGIDAGDSGADEDAAQESLRVLDHVSNLSSDPIRSPLIDTATFTHNPSIVPAVLCKRRRVQGRKELLQCG
jgi:hypothetical protein